MGNLNLLTNIYLFIYVLCVHQLIKYLSGLSQSPCSWLSDLIKVTCK